MIYKKKQIDIISKFASYIIIALYIIKYSNFDMDNNVILNSSAENC